MSPAVGPLRVRLLRTPIVLALLLLACGGEPRPAPPAASAGPADGRLELFVLNRLHAFGEGVPCRPEALVPLATAALARDEAAERSDAAGFFAIGDTLVIPGWRAGFKPLDVAVEAIAEVELQALAAARPTAWVPGARDLALGPAALLDRAAALGIPVLASNLDVAGAPEPLRTLVVQAGSLRVGFLGLLPGRTANDEFGGDDVEMRAAVATARRLSEKLRAEDGVHLVVAFSTLTTKLNESVAAVPGVNIVYGSLDDKFGSGVLVVHGNSAALAALPDGAELAHTTIQIRDGNLNMADVSSLHNLPQLIAADEAEVQAAAERFGTTDAETLASLAYPDNREFFLRMVERIGENQEFLAEYSDYAGSMIDHWYVDPRPVPDEHPVQQRLAQRGPALEAAYATARLKPAEPPEGTPLIPQTSACTECHASQVKFWQSTAHAQAVEALAADQRLRDPACLRCHTTGFGEQGGWIDPRFDAPFGAVTCYSCHQVTANHMTTRRALLDPLYVVAEAERMDCASCHVPRRSPDFVRERALPLVACPPSPPDDPQLLLLRHQAVEHIRTRRERGEDEPRDRYLEGRALAALGGARRAEGLDVLLEVALKNASDARMAIEIARLLDEYGQSVRARDSLRTYLTAQPGDPAVNLEFVRLLVSPLDPAAAEPLQALAMIDVLIPPDSEAADEKALLDYRLLQVEALFMTGRTQEAATLVGTLAGKHGRDPRLQATMERWLRR